MYNKINIIEKYFFFKKYKIYYFVKNHQSSSKIGILLLHGRYTHAGYWNIISEDESKYKYFAFDYPGQGKSSGQRGRCNTYKLLSELCFNFVSNVICDYKIDHLYIIGESLGSLVGFYTVMNYILPIQVQGIVFMPGLYQLAQLEYKKYQLLLTLMNKLIPTLRLKNIKPFTFYTNDKNILQALENDKNYCRYSSIRYIYGIYKYVEYLNDHIDRFDHPILIFHGQFDHYSDGLIVNKFYNKIKVSVPKHLVILKNSKHWLNVSDEIKVINSCIFEWIIERESNIK
jgi:alpha-beta hydrolase superfamily lysophospholipase